MYMTLQVQCAVGVGGCKLLDTVGVGGCKLLDTVGVGGCKLLDVTPGNSKVSKSSS